MFDQLKHLFTLASQPAGPAAMAILPADALGADLEQRLLLVLQQVRAQRRGYEPVKLAGLPAYEAIKQLDSPTRVALIERLVDHIKALIDRPYSETIGTQREVYRGLLTLLLRSSLDLNPADCQRLLVSYGEFPARLNEWQRNVFTFPVLLTLTQVQKAVQVHGLPAGLRGALVDLQTRARTHDGSYYPTEASKARARISEILNEDGPADAAPALRFSVADGFGRLLQGFANILTAAAPNEPASTAWMQLLRLWRKAEGGKPTAKFLKEARQHISLIGAEHFREQARHWLNVLQQLDATEERRHYAYDYIESYYLDAANQTVVKGLIGSLQTVADDADALQQLADYAAKCYRKVPGVGPLCPMLGNACVYVLGQAGLPGVAHLSRLRVKEKNRTVLKVLDKQLGEVATRLGMSPADLEDLAIPTYDLQSGRACYHFEGYRAEVQVRPNATAELRWYRADGTTLKAEPVALKKAQPAAVKALKQGYLQLQQTLTAQRDRLERAYLADRSWTYAQFESSYLQHPLMGALAQPLIWHLTRPDGSRANALWLEGGWYDAHEQPLPGLDAATGVQLWHPALAPAEEVLAWRELLTRRELRQPFKQAYREVYLLTVAEERTDTYSNRMAAHILRQHQLAALARQRGWDYRLMGGFDHGSNGASIELPVWGLRAEFWASEVANNATLTDAGIYQYVATDQVRFSRQREFGPLPLREVPAVVFSEIMRDVDLFVGVASVGNDPNWRDNGGLPQYHDYWHSYSFGELSEVAKTRRAVLERLVPRLKIARVSEVQDKFLVVRGRLRTYKIHLGSGNILMSPNDQYLCIVPDGSRRGPAATDVFLPFEGDAVLSIILSKALLLAEDDKITDPSITRQIRG